MFGKRFHTIPDVDAGRIPNQGGRSKEPSTRTQPPFYFGGANFHSGATMQKLKQIKQQKK